MRLLIEALARTVMIEGGELLVCFGDCLEPGVYHLHSRFARALNYLGGERLLSLVTPQVGGGPTNIVLSDIGWVDSPSLRVTADCVVIGSQTIALPPACRYQSELTFAEADMLRSVQHFGAFERILIESSPPLSFAFVLEEARKSCFTTPFDRHLAERVIEAWNLLKRLNVAAGVHHILGTGYGLTPSGDDFVAGWAAGLRLLADLYQRDTADELALIARQIVTGNPISRNLLWCALRGRYVERVRNLLQAIIGGSRREVEQRAQEVLRIGETSGADFSTGLVASLKVHGILADPSLTADGRSSNTAT